MEINEIHKIPNTREEVTQSDLNPTQSGLLTLTDTAEDTAVWTRWNQTQQSCLSPVKIKHNCHKDNASHAILSYIDCFCISIYKGIAKVLNLHKVEAQH